jgi:hypothetical protein
MVGNTLPQPDDSGENAFEIDPMSVCIPADFKEKMASFGGAACPAVVEVSPDAEWDAYLAVRGLTEGQKLALKSTFVSPEDYEAARQEQVDPRLKIVLDKFSALEGAEMLG